MTTSEAITSVIIVNYHAYPEVRACLLSLGRFVDRDLEVILVDHETNAVEVDRLEEMFPWLRVIRAHDNPGFAAGVNRGVRVAKGRYLLLLNPDCLVDSDVSRGLAEWLDGQPSFGAVGPRILDSDGTLQASARRFPDFTTALGGRTSLLTRVIPSNTLSRRNLLAGGQRDPITVDWVSGACVMIKRDAFRAVGGMDEGFFLYWEDADLCFRLKQQGWLTAYHPFVQVTHACGASSAHAATKSLVAFHRSAYRYYRKHTGMLGTLLAPVVLAGLQARLALKLTRAALNR